MCVENYSNFVSQLALLCRKLQDSIKGERVPEKRLSVRLRTGEWLADVTLPARVKKRKGSELIRTSIRRKRTTKEEETGRKIDEQKSDGGNNQPLATKPDVVIDADKLSEQPKSPSRKTSIRRKNMQKGQEKQVTFDDDKIEKIIFEDSPIHSTPYKIVDKSDSPRDDVAEDSSAQKPTDSHRVEVTVVQDSEPDKSQEQTANSYDNAIFSSSSTFQNYHNSFQLPVPEAKEKVDFQQEESAEKEKSSKKIRVVKRKGSSRRKVLSKITDDSERDSLFTAPQGIGIQSEKEPSAENKRNDPLSSENGNQDLVKEENSSDIISNVMGQIAHEFESIEKQVAGDDIGNSDIVIEERSVVDSESSHQNNSGAPPHAQLNEFSSYVAKSDQENVTLEETQDDYQLHDARNAEELATTIDAMKNDELQHSPGYAGLDMGLSDVLDKFSSHTQNLGSNPPDAKIETDLDIKGQSSENLEESPNHVSASAHDITSVFDQESEKSEVSTFSEPTFDRPASPHDEVIRDDAESQTKIKKKITKKVIKKKKVDKRDEETLGPESTEVKPPEQTGDKDFDLIQDVVTLSVTAPDSEEKKDNAESPIKPRKKVVKKIIKKKNIDGEEEQHESPKKENQDDEPEKDEELTENVSRLTRKKTVRKRVVKKPSPQQD